MTNDDPMYVRHIENALEAAELEIKGLEGELREQDKILAEMQEQLAPTRMGEPMIRDCSVTNNMLQDATEKWQHYEKMNAEQAATIERQAALLKQCKRALKEFDKHTSGVMIPDTRNRGQDAMDAIEAWENGK